MVAGVTTPTTGPSVFLNGTVTHASGVVSFTGTNFSATAGNIYLMAGGELHTFGCLSAISSNQFFSFTSTALKAIFATDCVFSGTGTSTFAVMDGSAMTVSFIGYDCNIGYPVQMTCTGAAASFSLSLGSSVLSLSCAFSCGGFNYDMRQMTSIHGDGTHALVTSGASTTSGSFAIRNSSVGVPPAGNLFDFTLGSGMDWLIDNCSVGDGSSWSYIESASNNLRNSSFYLDTTGNSQANQNARLVFNCSNTGWRGTQWHVQQSMAQFSSASIQTLISIPVAAGSAITLQGQITGSNAGHTDITGGNFMVVADGTAAALIGGPVCNINASTTGTFAASFSGGNLLIQVTAPSAAAYNWVSTFQYQFLQDNT